MAMTGAEYDALVKLMRGSPESAANRAARRVLVDGISQAEARRETGATRSTVSDAVTRIEKADHLIRGAYGLKARE
jgi:DNA-binding MarR family transcriptional regulator